LESKSVLRFACTVSLAAIVTDVPALHSRMVRDQRHIPENLIHISSLAAPCNIAQVNMIRRDAVEVRQGDHGLNAGALEVVQLLQRLIVRSAEKNECVPPLTPLRNDGGTCPTNTTHRLLLKLRETGVNSTFVAC
jgi:hypothetical protein